MRILVVGGAGYIGSHMVRYLMDREHEVTVLGWSPQYGALETIIDHAWRFERARYGRP